MGQVFCHWTVNCCCILYRYANSKNLFFLCGLITVDCHMFQWKSHRKKQNHVIHLIYLIQIQSVMRFRLVFFGSILHLFLTVYHALCYVMCMHKWLIQVTCIEGSYRFWKSLESSEIVEIFKVLKSRENDMENAGRILENCDAYMENEDVCYTSAFVNFLAFHKTNHHKFRVQ